MRRKNAWEMTDFELARIAKLFYKAQLDYPRGINHAMEDFYLGSVIATAETNFHLTDKVLFDVLMLFHKRGIMKIHIWNQAVSLLSIIGIHAGDATIAFIQESTEVRRRQRWTRGLAIAAIIISLASLALSCLSLYLQFRPQ